MTKYLVRDLDNKHEGEIEAFSFSEAVKEFMDLTDQSDPHDPTYAGCFDAVLFLVVDLETSEKRHYRGYGEYRVDYEVYSERD